MALAPDAASSVLRLQHQPLFLAITSNNSNIIGKGTKHRSLVNSMHSNAPIQVRNLVNFSTWQSSIVFRKIMLRIGVGNLDHTLGIVN